MTSSLVGSEMCIRDRPKRTTQRPSATPSLHGHTPPSPTDHSNTRISEAPVSYTHLTLPTICSV
eukprot:7217481-Prorocentrum_lima.AAC.1